MITIHRFLVLLLHTVINNFVSDYVSAASCPTLKLSSSFFKTPLSFGNDFYFDNDWAATFGNGGRWTAELNIWKKVDRWYYSAHLLEFFGTENFWDKEYEVVQKGSRNWIGTVYVGFKVPSSSSRLSSVPFYGYQKSDGGYSAGKFAEDDTLTLKSCIDNIELGIIQTIIMKLNFV